MRALAITSLILFFICGCNNGYEKQLAANTDSTYLGNIAFNSVQLVRTANLDLKVASVQKSADSLCALTQRFGGYVYNRSLHTDELQQKELKSGNDSLLLVTAFSPKASLRLRVPVQVLDSFIALAQLSHAFVQKMDVQTDDNTLAYESASRKGENRKAVLEQMPKQVQRTTTAEKKIAITDESIDLWQTQQQIGMDAAYSLVNIELSQNAVVRSEVIANANLDRFQLSVWQRIKDSVSNGAGIILEMFIALVALWPLLLLSIAVLLLYRNYKRKSATPALLK